MLVLGLPASMILLSVVLIVLARRLHDWVFFPASIAQFVLIPVFVFFAAGGV